MGQLLYCKINFLSQLYGEISPTFWFLGLYTNPLFLLFVPPQSFDFAGVWPKAHYIQIASCSSPNKDRIERGGGGETNIRASRIPTQRPR